jgi:charged multivesicular body protein 6
MSEYNLTHPLLSYFRKAPAAPPPQTRAKPTLSQQDRAILDLKIARDKLRQHQVKVEAESVTLLCRAQGEYKKGDKKRGVYFMKIKKLKESKVDEINSQLLNLEQMVQTIEWTTQSVAVVSAMERAQLSLTKLQEEIPVERVEALMDDVAESVQMQQEIDRALAVGLPGSSVEEMEDELDAELQALSDSLDTTTTPAMLPALPVAPTTTPVVSVSAAQTSAHSQEVAEEEEERGLVGAS